MDPGNGRLYTASEVAVLKRTDPEVAARLVHMAGSEQSIRDIAAHVERGTRGDRRRAARKAQKLARRKNRR